MPFLPQKRTYRSYPLTNNEKDVIIHVSPTQKAFLDYCTEIGWGVLEKVQVKNGEPVMVSVVHQDIKFD